MASPSIRARQYHPNPNPLPTQHSDATHTHTHTQAQFALWCIMAAPLLMGNDLRSLRPEHKAILLNKELIEIDQEKKPLIST